MRRIGTKHARLGMVLTRPVFDNRGYLLIEEGACQHHTYAGCSIGAEPYSVAMMLDELSPNGKHRILATDLDDQSLDRAQAGGPYSESHLEQVASGIKLKNFVKSDAGYKVAPKFKTMVDFRRHNLLSDRFEDGFDLIMCRNVTIYFTDQTKSGRD